MSLARVNSVKKAAKPQGTCGARGCEVGIQPGMSYLWFKVGFRSRYKHVRCVDHYPRPSERESSMLSTAYAAIEDFEDSLPGCETAEDVIEAVHTVGEAFSELASEYSSASEDQNGTVFNQEAAERAEVLEASGDELQSWEPDSDAPEGCEDHEESQDDCEECGNLRDDWLEEVRSAASSAVNDAETP